MINPFSRSLNYLYCAMSAHSYQSCKAKADPNHYNIHIPYAPMDYVHGIFFTKVSVQILRLLYTIFGNLALVFTLLFGDVVLLCAPILRLILSSFTVVQRCLESQE